MNSIHVRSFSFLFVVFNLEKRKKGFCFFDLKNYEISFGINFENLQLKFCMHFL